MPDVLLDDVLRPSFWAHHVDKFREDDLVDVISMDRAFDVQLRVVGKGVGYVNMDPLRVKQRHEVRAANETAEEIAAPDGYSVNFAPKQGWRVMTKEPHLIISKDHKSRAEAVNAAVAHAAKANAVAA